MRFASKAKAGLHSASAAPNRITHIGVAGAVQGVDAGPTQLRPELLQKVA